MSDSLSLLLIVAVSLCAYLFGNYRRGEAELRQQVEAQRLRAELAEQRLADVLAIPLPKGYGAAIGAKPKPQDPYEQEQAAIFRANYNND